MRTLVAFVIVVCSLTLAKHATSGVCDTRLKPSSDSTYQYKTRDANRCEGFYRSKISTKSLEVAGLLRGKLSYDLVQTETVSITCRTIADDTVYVRAQALPMKTYYRMDGRIEPGEQFIWPVKDVLLPKQLRCSVISVLGFYTDRGDSIYVPVSAEPKINKVKRDDVIRIVFRSDFDLHPVYYKYRIFSNGLTIDWRSVSGKKKYRKGTPIVIDLPKDLRGLLELQVSVKELDRDDGSITKSYMLNLGSE